MSLIAREPMGGNDAAQEPWPPAGAVTQESYSTRTFEGQSLGAALMAEPIDIEEERLSEHDLHAFVHEAIRKAASTHIRALLSIREGEGIALAHIFQELTHHPHWQVRVIGLDNLASACEWHHTNLFHNAPNECESLITELSQRLNEETPQVRSAMLDCIARLRALRASECTRQLNICDKVL